MHPTPPPYSRPCKLPLPPAGATLAIHTGIIYSSAPVDWTRPRPHKTDEAWIRGPAKDESGIVADIVNSRFVWDPGWGWRPVQLNRGAACGAVSGGVAWALIVFLQWLERRCPFYYQGLQRMRLLLCSTNVPSATNRLRIWNWHCATTLHCLAWQRKTFFIYFFFKKGEKNKLQHDIERTCECTSVFLFPLGGPTLVPSTRPYQFSMTFYTGIQIHNLSGLFSLTELLNECPSHIQICPAAIMKTQGFPLGLTVCEIHCFFFISLPTALTMAMALQSDCNPCFLCVYANVCLDITDSGLIVSLPAFKKIRLKSQLNG